MKNFSWQSHLTHLKVNQPWKLRVQYFSSVVSTQDVFLKEIVRDHELVLIVADEQSKGRGRGERLWKSLQGNFHGTLVVKRPLQCVFPLTTLSLLSGAAVASSIESLIPSHHQVELKWPNDILIDGKKCAGILCSASGDELRVGVGVNLLINPHIKDMRESLALGEINPFLEPESWLQKFLSQWIELYSQWVQGRDKDWREIWSRLAKFDRPMRLTNGELVIPIGLDWGGELRVLKDQGSQSLSIEELI